VFLCNNSIKGLRSVFSGGDDKFFHTNQDQIARLLRYCGLRDYGEIVGIFNAQTVYQMLKIPLLKAKLELLLWLQPHPNYPHLEANSYLNF